MMLTPVSTTEDTELTEETPFPTKRAPCCFAKDLTPERSVVTIPLPQPADAGQKNTRRGGRVLGRSGGLLIRAAWA